MFALFTKEINSFLNSFIGYLVIFVFLVTLSLFLWVFPGSEFSIPESGYAALDPLFIITPWVYMFLVPAVTMRLFSEEKKSGTLELLLTRPLTELQVVMAKFLAGLTLVVFSLVPTLIYYWSIRALGAPPGNVDAGSVWGSYIGLLFLGSAFVAVGVCCSALSDNQVIAFILAVFVSFILYAGFDALSGVLGAGMVAETVYQFGMNAHYASMGRGVLDTRDVLYFLSVSALFIMITRTILESRKW